MIIVFILIIQMLTFFFFTECNSSIFTFSYIIPCLFSFSHTAYITHNILNFFSKKKLVNEIFCNIFRFVVLLEVTAIDKWCLSKLQVRGVQSVNSFFIGTNVTAFLPLWPLWHCRLWHKMNCDDMACCKIRPCLKHNLPQNDHEIVKRKDSN